MALPKPSYFFAPLDSAVDGPIALGSLIESVKFANSPLNQAPETLEDSEIKKPSDRTNFKIKVGATNGGSIGMWTDFLGPLASVLPVNGSASAEYKITTESDISCDLLETRYFVPSPDYVQKSIAAEGVKIWLKANKPWFGRSSKLFMITGVKIAHNATLAYKYIKDRGVKFHFGLDGTNSGVPLKIGTEGDLRADRSTEQSFGIVEPFVMAFQVHEVRIRLKDEAQTVLSTRLHDDGAVLSIGKGSDGKDIEVVGVLDTGSVGAEEAETETESNEYEDEEGAVCVFAHSNLVEEE